jgi:hypothetical protein
MRKSQGAFRPYTASVTQEHNMWALENSFSGPIYDDDGFFR